MTTPTIQKNFKLDKSTISQINDIKDYFLSQGIKVSEKNIVETSINHWHEKLNLGGDPHAK